MAPAPSASAPGGGAAPGREPRFPRWLLWLGVPAVGLLLVGFFVFLQFPFDRFADGLARNASSALGAQVAVGRLDPALTRAGPGFVARDVRIVWPDGQRATVSRATLRPAWSLAWLRGAPALHVDLESDVGAVRGALTLGDAPSFGGRLTEVALDRLPLERLAPGTTLAGRLDLDADLRLGETGPIGEARFSARDGSLQTGPLPFAVPYEALNGALRFADDGSLALEDVRLEGPMVSAEARGGAGPSPSLWLAPLELDVHLVVSDRNLRPSFRSAGLRLGPDGSADLRIRGNLAAPVIR